MIFEHAFSIFKIPNMIDLFPSHINGPLSPIPRLRVKKKNGGGGILDELHIYVFFLVGGGNMT